MSPNPLHLLARQHKLKDYRHYDALVHIFVVILLFDTAYGRLQMFRPRVLREAIVQ